MAQVQMIRPQQSGGRNGAGGIGGTGVTASDALMAAGMVAGAMFPPAGAGIIAGAAGGGGLGAMVGGLADKQMNRGSGGGGNQQVGAVGVPSSGEGSKAISRRLEQIAADNGSTSNYDKLVAAEAATAQLPEKMRQEYQPALIQARLLEQQRLGMV